ncbi:TPA: hypothetical protein ACKP1B_005777 [Serratia fonticola]
MIWRQLPAFISPANGRYNIIMPTCNMRQYSASRCHSSKVNSLLIAVGIHHSQSANTGLQPSGNDLPDKITTQFGNTTQHLSLQ